MLFGLPIHSFVAFLALSDSHRTKKINNKSCLTSITTSLTGHDIQHSENVNDDSVSSLQSSSTFSSFPGQDRRHFGAYLFTTALTVVSTLTLSSSPFFLEDAQAFDGSGASASSGYNPSSKAQRVQGWKNRVIADVKDFKALGNALKEMNGNTSTSTSESATTISSSKEWINFFIQFQRREPDDVGRSFGALVDLRGLPTKKKYEYEGGDALLLATSFTKPGKPSENTPSVKAWNALFKTFDAIEIAGKKNDVVKALAAWETTKPLLEAYLGTVELPKSLDDPLYNN